MAGLCVISRLAYFLNPHHRAKHHHFEETSRDFIRAFSRREVLSYLRIFPSLKGQVRTTLVNVTARHFLYGIHGYM